VLVMVMPEELTGPVEDTPADWDRPYVEYSYRALPSADYS